MKLTVKTLNGSFFQIMVQPSDTIMAIKKNIEDVQGKHKYPCGQQLLIHGGKFLKDESTLAENKVSEVGFVVVMRSKSNALSPVGTASTLQSSSIASNAYGETTSYAVSGSNLERKRQRMMDMDGGNWDKGRVTPALPTAYKNMTASGAPNSTPLNLFPQDNLSGAGPLDFLRNNPQFQALRSMVQDNPQFLLSILHEIGNQSPQILRLIEDHHQEFLELISEPLNGPEGDLFDQAEPDMPLNVSVTPAEWEIIERLEAMGFDRDLVIEAFLECDRNEELAIDYLLERLAELSMAPRDKEQQRSHWKRRKLCSW